MRWAFPPPVRWTSWNSSGTSSSWYVRPVGRAYPNNCVVPARPDQVERACESLRFPCVIKPVDAYGSYGVRVDAHRSQKRSNQLPRFAEESRRANSVVLEEYDGGHEFNMITWASHGRVFPVSVADREKTVCAFEDLPHVRQGSCGPRVASPTRSCPMRSHTRSTSSVRGNRARPFMHAVFLVPRLGHTRMRGDGPRVRLRARLLGIRVRRSVEDLL